MGWARFRLMLDKQNNFDQIPEIMSHRRRSSLVSIISERQSQNNDLNNKNTDNV